MVSPRPRYWSSVGGSDYLPLWLADDGVLPSTTVLCGLLVAALLPFWLVNWPPASIFMGDSGAVFLGFTLVRHRRRQGSMINSLLGFAWLILMAPFSSGRWRYACSSDFGRVARLILPITTISTNGWRAAQGVPQRSIAGLLMLHGLWQIPSLMGLHLSARSWAFFMVFLSVIPTLFLLVRARRWR